MPNTHPLLSTLPLIRRVAKDHGAHVHVARALGVPYAVVVTCERGAEIEIELWNDEPAHVNVDGDLSLLGDGQDLSELIEARDTAHLDSDDSDDGWRRELAMEAGMLHGIGAYNEAMGNGS